MPKLSFLRHQTPLSAQAARRPDRAGHVRDRSSELSVALACAGLRERAATGMHPGVLETDFFLTSDLGLDLMRSWPLPIRPR